MSGYVCKENRTGGWVYTTAQIKVPGLVHLGDVICDYQNPLSCLGRRKVFRDILEDC
jgi:hypothetical protein